MKKTLFVVLSALIGLALAIPSFAQAPSTQNPTATAPEKSAKPMGKVKAMKFSGKVVSVDSSGNTAVVKGKKGEMTFNLSETKWKGYKSASEVKPGDKVWVRYVEKDGTMMATMVGKPWTKRMKSKIKKEEEKM